MRQRCPTHSPHFNAWQDRAAGTALLPASSAAALRAFLQEPFGLPDGSATVTADHLEGFVAEHLWHELVAYCPGMEELVLIEPPSISLTSHGGDGLAIHRLDDCSLRFRLWEVKKATGSSPVSTTITAAYTQLHSAAAQYLTEYALTGEGRHHGTELAAFYGQIPDLWLAAAPSAAAGVAVATSTPHAPTQCFSTFGTQFPQFATPNRLRGMLIALDDFPAFARLVQEKVWKGL